MGLHLSHHITSILWETKSFSQSSFEEKTLRGCLATKKLETGEEQEKREKTEQGSVYSIYWSIYYNGCKGIYIEKFFQPS